MAIYHLSAKVISRSAGRSVVAAAAYRSGMTLADERDGTTHDYSRRRGVEHREVLTPGGAPDWASDRARLWNAVEAAEKRKDSQLAREIEGAIPRELPAAERPAFVRGYLQQFADQGMVVDFVIHAGKARDGEEAPHFHALLTMREIGPAGFARTKARHWNDTFAGADAFKRGKGGEVEVMRTEGLEAVRAGYAAHVNAALERAGIAARVDHRSLEAQRAEAMEVANDVGRPEPERRLAAVQAVDLDREPEPKLGAAAAAMERRGETSERGDALRAVTARNAARRGLHRQLGDLVRAGIEAGREQLAALWKRAEAALQRQRERDPLYRYRAAVDQAQGDPLKVREAAARLEVAEEYQAAGKDPRHHAAAIITEADRRMMAAPPIAATTVPPASSHDENSKPEPDHAKTLEAWGAALERERQAIQRRAERWAPRAEQIMKSAYGGMVAHMQAQPEEPRGLGAMFGKGKYQAALAAWQRRTGQLSRRYESLKGRYGLLAGLRDDAHDQRRLAERRAKRRHPELAEAARAAAKAEQARRAEQERRERPVREAVREFETIAGNRRHGFYGYGDQGEHWRRLPPGLQQAVESFNAAPEGQRAAILDRMREQLRRDPAALKTLQEQLERPRQIDRGR